MFNNIKVTNKIGTANIIVRFLIRKFNIELQSQVLV